MPPNFKKDIKELQKRARELQKRANEPCEESGKEPCCDLPKIIEDDGFYVCLNCGSADKERIIDDSPRRAFTQEEIQKRKSNERVYSPIGPRTIIRGSRDARGTLLSPKYKSKFNRLAKIS